MSVVVHSRTSLVRVFDSFHDEARDHDKETRHLDITRCAERERVRAYSEGVGGGRGGGLECAPLLPACATGLREDPKK